MDIITLIVALAVLVWGAVFVLRGSLLGGCVAYLVMASCFGGEFYSFDAAGLTWSLDRFFLAGLMLAYLVQWRTGRLKHRPLVWGDACLIALIVLVSVSAFTHDWRNLFPTEVPIVMHLINGYLIPLILYWIARHSPVTRRDAAWLHGGLILFGLYLATTAMLEISGQWSLVFPRYIADSEMGIHFGRARGPMLQSARFGVYLIVCLAASWLVLAWQGRLGRWGVLLGVALVPLYAAATYFTYTRSVWLGMGMAVFLIAAFTLRGRARPLVLGSMIVAALGVGIVKKDQLIAFKREYTASETRESTYMRASFTYVSWQMFKQRPLLGFGFGQFARECQPFLSDRSTGLRLEAIRGYVHHNTLLCVLVEVGLVGLLLYLAALFYWIRSGWRLWRATGAPAWMKAHGLLFLCVFAAHLPQLIFRDVSYSQVENGLVFLLAAATVNMLGRTAESTQPYVSGNRQPESSSGWSQSQWRPSSS